jgi:hypothetical protein
METFVCLTSDGGTVAYMKSRSDFIKLKNPRWLEEGILLTQQGLSLKKNPYKPSLHASLLTKRAGKIKPMGIPLSSRVSWEALGKAFSRLRSRRTRPSRFPFSCKRKSYG